MATGGHGQADASLDPSLGEDDLGTLHSALYPARSNYKSFALQIGVKIGDIDNVEANYTDHGDLLLGILTVRVKKAEPLTWGDIDAALRLECVGESKTANRIRKKYGHLFSPSPSVRGTIDIQHEQETEYQVQGKQKKTRRERKSRRCTSGDRSSHIEKQQEESSDEEVSERGERQKFCEREEEFSHRFKERATKRIVKKVKGEASIEKQLIPVERVRKKAGCEKERNEPEVYERAVKNEAKATQKKKTKVKLVESDDESTNAKATQKKKAKVKLVESDDESNNQTEKNKVKATRKKKEKAEESDDDSSYQKSKKNEAKAARKKKEKAKLVESDDESNIQTEKNEAKATQTKKTPKLIESEDENTNQMEDKSRKQKEVPDLESSDKSGDEEMVGSLFHRDTKEKGLEGYTSKKKKKEGKKEKRGRRSAALATGEQEQYSDEEVSKNPAHKSKKSKEVKSKPETEDECCTSTGEEEISGDDFECTEKAIPYNTKKEDSNKQGKQ